MTEQTAATAYEAHATMRDGTARPVKVNAADAVEARRRMFALLRAVSITAPREVVA